MLHFMSFNNTEHNEKSNCIKSSFWFMCLLFLSEAKEPTTGVPTSASPSSSTTKQGEWSVLWVSPKQIKHGVLLSSYYHHNNMMGVYNHYTIVCKIVHYYFQGSMSLIIRVAIHNIELLYRVSQKEVPPTFEKSLKKNLDVLWLKYLYGSKAYYVFGILWKNEIVWKSHFQDMSDWTLLP